MLETFDWLIIYSILGIVWSFQLEVMNRKGFWMRVGMILFIPFLMIVLIINKNYKPR